MVALQQPHIYGVASLFPWMRTSISLQQGKTNLFENVSVNKPKVVFLMLTSYFYKYIIGETS
jgi:hypothetical protein